MYKKESPKHCLTIDDLEIGQTTRRPYTITYEMVEAFSKICGDWNPVHHDPEYAAETIFKAQIAHGMISVSQFSAIFGMESPGLGTVYLSQNIEFLRPVYLDSSYTAVAEVSAICQESKTVTYLTWCEDSEGNKIIDGSATVKAIPQKIKHNLNLDKYLG
ncbi:MAG: MaoC family dehydratase [Pseudomonadota bacterium]|nr:MaoC family dehydratase [Pseudomonadota bacterium]